MQYNLLWLVWGLWFYLIIHYGVGDQHFYVTLKSRWKIVAVIILSCGLIYAVYLLSSSMRIQTMFKRKSQNTTFADTNADINIASSLNSPQVSYLGDDVELTVKPSHSVQTEPSIAVIPETCIIKGELNSTSDIHVNGRIDGIVRSEKTVHILKSGHVEGDIIAYAIAVDGVLNGNCIGGEVSINAQGVVNGQVKSDSLAIHKNGRFYGNSLPRTEEEDHENAFISAMDAVKENTIDISDFHRE
ncbi:polymer-forming cytoskeletal protein [Salmonella enterica subsp. enterica serovar Reading]|nr:polymer-forming cytoskeletal protein [Salmonella enterica subsp. enterica serovar Reading]